MRATVIIDGQGAVKKVTFDLAPVSHEEDKALHQHAANHAVGDGAAG